MNNILHNNYNNLRLTINNDEYWDFCINKDSYQTYFPKKGLKEECLISYIDSDDPDCVFFDKLYSKTSYKWKIITSLCVVFYLYDITLNGHQMLP